MLGKKEAIMIRRIEAVEALVKSRTKQLEKGMTELTAALEKQLNEKRVAFVSVLDSLKERIVILEKQLDEKITMEQLRDKIFGRDKTVKKTDPGLLEAVPCPNTGAAEIKKAILN